MNYVHQLTMQSKIYILTHFNGVVNHFSDQLNSDLISNNINLHANFEVLLPLDLNTGVFAACLMESFRLLSSTLCWW